MPTSNDALHQLLYDPHILIEKLYLNDRGNVIIDKQTCERLGLKDGKHLQILRDRDTGELSLKVSKNEPTSD